MLSIQKSPTCAEACYPARTPAATRWQPCVNFATLEGAATGVKQVDWLIYLDEARTREVVRELRLLTNGKNNRNPNATPNPNPNLTSTWVSVWIRIPIPVSVFQTLHVYLFIILLLLVYIVYNCEHHILEAA